MTLSFGDPQVLAGVVRESDAQLIIQVVDMAEARRALEVGADVIVAQGTEAGGHRGKRATLPVVPAVVDLVPSNTRPRSGRYCGRTGACCCPVAGGCRSAGGDEISGERGRSC